MNFFPIVARDPTAAADHAATIRAGTGAASPADESSRRRGGGEVMVIGETKIASFESYIFRHILFLSLARDSRTILLEDKLLMTT